MASVPAHADQDIQDSSFGVARCPKNQWCLTLKCSQKKIVTCELRPMSNSGNCWPSDQDTPLGLESTTKSTKTSAKSTAEGLRFGCLTGFSLGGCQGRVLPSFTIPLQTKNISSSGWWFQTHSLTNISQTNNYPKHWRK